MDAQIGDLTEAGCQKIFSEKASGAKSDRVQLAKALKALQPGDQLIVTRLDRLARSTRDLLNIIDDLAKRNIGFKALKDSWCDLSTAHGRLMLTVISGLAQFERELILSRTSEGRARAKAQGIKMGRPFKMSHYQRLEALERLEKGATQMELARSYGVSQTTISVLANTN